MSTERLVFVMSAAILAACGSEEEVVVPLAAESPPSAVEVEAAPRHGGTLVEAGDHRVEVVAQRDGVVNAYVVSEAPPPPERTRVTVRVPADDGAVHPVVLTWSPSEARYVGRLRRAHPVAGPVELVLVHDGQTFRGRHPQVIVIAPEPAVVVDGPALAVERPSPTVVVERPSPTVVVERPNPVVVVERPNPVVVVERPRPVVVVERPSPVVVVDPHPRRHVVVHGPAPHVRVHGHHGPHVRVHGGGGHHGHGHGPRVRVRH